MQEKYCFCGNQVPPGKRRFCSYSCLAVGSRAQLYGIDGAAYQTLLRMQSGACALCGRPLVPVRGGLVIDHDHRTGVVRGLLCQSCNLKIAFIERTDPQSLRPGAGEFAHKALRYLERTMGGDAESGT